MQNKIDHLRTLPVPAQSLFIGGAWQAARSGATMDVISPIDGKVLTTIADAGADDVDLAVSAARAAFEKAYLEAGLRASGGNMAEAARRAGLDRSHHFRLLKRHGVKP